jgi:hypothetical protein
MIVVPTLASCKQSDPPIVSRVITVGESPGSPHMGGRVDEPSGVKTYRHSQKDAPKNYRPTANREQDQGEEGERNPMVAIQPAIKIIFHQIRGVLSKQVQRWRLIRGWPTQRGTTILRRVAYADLPPDPYADGARDAWRPTRVAHPRGLVWRTPQEHARAIEARCSLGE